MEVIFTGEVIDAQEVYQIGIVHNIVAEAEVETTAIDMAQGISEKTQSL